MDKHPALKSIEAINANQPDIVRSLHADDMVLLEMPFGDEGLRGPDGKMASSARFRKAMPNDLRNNVLNVIEAGDWVIIEGTVTGTHEGPLELPEVTIEASGEKVELPYCTLAQARDGKVVAVKHYYDTTELRSLGAAGG